MTSKDTDRRNFLKVGAAVAAGAAMAPLAAEAAEGVTVFNVAPTTLPIVGSSQRFPQRTENALRGALHAASIVRIAHDDLSS